MTANRSSDFRQWLKTRTLLFDGGMGTELYKRGIFINRCFDELNLTTPDMVGKIHRQFVEAGADIIETNTFGANRIRLSRHGVEDNLEAINRAGVELARKAAGETALVAGAMGPLGIRIEPWGKMAREEARDVYREQADILYKSGVDLFLLESFVELSPLEQAILGVREVSDHPIVAQLTVTSEGITPFGTPMDLFVREMEKMGVDAIGINCSVGPEAMLSCLEVLAQITSLPISVMPNAGQPREVEGRNIFLGSPEYFATYARRFVQAGASMVGGCCGVSPADIKAMRNAIRALKPEHHRSITPLEKKVTAMEAVEPITQEKKSHLGAKIARGEFPVLVELTPPRGITATKTLAKAARLKEAGVDAINIPDGPRASTRMGAMGLALLMEREVGIETVLHYCCRDRNLLSMQSDLLGLYAAGLRNILVITGDPPKMGDYPDATAVFDVDSIGLTNVVHRLNHGLDIGGTPFGKPTGWLAGVGCNPGAVNLDFELRRFKYKVEAGAEFAITQPVFDEDQLLHFLQQIESHRIPVLAGMWPLVSLRNAEFMRNEVPGVHVPDEVMARMEAAEAKGTAKEEGLQICLDILAKVRPHIDGVQVSAPLGNIEKALVVVEAAKTGI